MLLKAFKGLGFSNVFDFCSDISFFSTLGRKFGHLGGRIRILRKKLYTLTVGNVWRPSGWFIRGFVDFSDFCSEVFSSQSILNSTEVDRKFGKTLLECRVEFPQMEAPNGLRENRKLLINQSASCSLTASFT